MKKLVTIALAVFLLTAVLFPVSAAENTVYISPNDSIADAIAKVSGGGIIVLQSGTYNMTEVINLTSSHSNITFRGDGNVTITGGSEVPFSSFSKCKDTAFLDALSDQSIRDRIVTVNLKDLGITNLGEIKPQGFTSPGGSGYAPTLTYLDKALIMARYPNNDYVYTETVSTDTSTKYFNNHYKVTYTLTDKRYEGEVFMRKRLTV